MIETFKKNEQRGIYVVYNQIRFVREKKFL